ncbi:unnamed protein product [Chironomus riparius]|uniref:UDP-glucuronosyltransferase n=1 Tax=Chironomus riparius TaxID=315576 RepID=A0A9N9WUN6_9DIPT|nr:unnamed protein product [Chironomus riparius]
MKVLVILLFFLNVTCGLKILGIFHYAMKSHYLIGNSIVNSLLDAGHNVTAITQYKPDKPINNYRVVQLPENLEPLKPPGKTPLDIAGVPPLVFSFYLPFFSYQFTEIDLRSTELIEFLKEDEKFDICIVELFLGEALLGVAEQAGCKIIQYTTFDSYIWSDNMLGNDSPSSYVPHSFLYYSDQMSFTQRLWNSVFTIIDKLNYNVVALNFQKYLYNKYFPNARRSFDEMYKNASLIFINNHVSASFVRPHMPNQIEIGGIHVKPAKTLPIEFQRFLNEAADGVIIFSMGSFLDGTDWKIEQREAFIKTFGKLKQKVLWRYSNETLPENPGNIKIGTWFPQRDMMAHPNVKLFITHGGLLGTTEAIVEGVPILGIPIFGDQKMNMAKTIARGYGLQILVPEITEENLSNKINELLNNPKYNENAKRISKIFNDRPKTPQEEVIYWTEYVARHNGAAHLQAASVNLNFIEFNLIDVYCTILVVLLVAFYVWFKITLAVIRCAFSKRKADKKQTQ